MNSSTERPTGPGDILEAVLETAPETVVVRNPTVDVLDDFVRRLHANDDCSTDIGIVATENALRELSEQFVLGAMLADLVESGAVSVGAGPFDETDQPNLLVTPTSTTALVPTADSWVTLRSGRDDSASALFDESSDLLEGSVAFDVRTPGVSRIRATITDALEPACARDFDRVFQTLETTRGPTSDIDESVMFLLLAARHRQLFYDLGRWAEGIGIASKATLSRKKTRLEDHGLIASEDVRMDVGRPRHRLCLVDEQLRDAPAEELSAVAVQVS